MDRRDFIRGATLGAVVLTGVQAATTAAVAQPATGAATDNLYVDPRAGSDTNPGTKAAPLRSLPEAARRVNKSTGTGPVTITLTEGLHAISEQALFKPENRTFTRENRLTIRAEVMPDDPQWDTGRMPILIFTLPLEKKWFGRPIDDGAADGIYIDTSHVSILGLKLLGMPVVETPKEGQIMRLYGISRLNPKLDDLELGHCMFLGDIITNPSHVAVIALGNNINTHHCVFHGAKITVVYWSGESTGHSMTNCIVNSCYGSGIWTASIADDFVFKNNVFSNNEWAWTYQTAFSAAADEGGRARPAGQAGPPPPRPGGPPGAGGPPPPVVPTHRYKVVDSYFAGNKHLTGSGTGARLGYREIDSGFLQLANTKVVAEAVTIEMDQTKRTYLHPVAGSEAAKVGAGLFAKPVQA